MSALQDFVVCFARGCLDSLAWPVSIVAIYKSDRVKTTASKCFILNGCVFLGSLFFFNSIIKPLLTLVLTYTIPGLESSWENNGAELATFNAMFNFMYNMLWVYPIYCVSFILNSAWYQDIADDSYVLQVGKPSAYVTNRDGLLKQLSSRISDEVYRSVMQFFFLIQVSLVYKIPVIGPLLSLICMSWLYALYCFEYKWINKGWNLERRITYFEHHWLYFCGFGMPFAMSTFFIPGVVASGVFAILFPSYIIMANRARPMTHFPGGGAPPSHGENIVTERVPIFSASSYVTSKFIQMLNRRSSNAIAKKSEQQSYRNSNSTKMTRASRRNGKAEGSGSVNDNDNLHLRGRTDGSRNRGESSSGRSSTRVRR